MQSFSAISFAYVFTSNVYQVDLLTGIVHNLGALNPNNSINALGYNILDGYIYGYDITTHNVCRVSSDGTIQDICTVPNLPQIPYSVGDVDSNGYYYFTETNSTTMYVVDINPLRITTFGKLVDPATKALSSTGTTMTGSMGGTSIGTGDWAFNPMDGQIYYSKNSDGIVRRLNPLTGVITQLTINIPTPGVFNSTVFGPNNDMYTVDNLSAGNIYQYNITGNTVKINLFSSIAYSLNPVDAARYAAAPLYFAEINNSLETSLSYANVGETIIYTISLNNIGNTDAHNFILLSTISSSTSFLANSVNFNGITLAGDPSSPTGINLGTIPVGSNTVTFSVIATSIPAVNPISNKSTFTYNFTDPSNNITYSRAGATTTATTSIVDLIVTDSIIVSTLNTKIGDILTYTIAYSSSGNVSTNSLLFTNTVPAGTSYVSGTLTQDGTYISGSISSPGITLPNQLINNDISTISFQTQVVSIPANPLISNTSALSYSYISDPILLKSQNKVITSSSQGTALNDPLMSTTKTVDKLYAQVGDVLTYTILINNSGSVGASNILLTDTISSYTVFVPNSLYINGVLQTLLNPNPPGISIPNMVANSTSTITFKVIITTIPQSALVNNSANIIYNYTAITTIPNGATGSLNTNIITTTIPQAILSNSKAVNKGISFLGDTITYSIYINNLGNTIANGIIIDTIPSSTNFVANSLKVNGVSKPGATITPPNGYTLNNIEINTPYTITFDVVPFTNPIGDIIINSNYIGYNFTQYPSVPNGAHSGITSNSVPTTIIRNSAILQKSVLPSYATCGDTITYVVSINNTGNIDIIYGYLIDTLPSSMVFIPNSAMVNGIPRINESPNTGIQVGTIPINSISTITFKARVLCQ